jgi:hypothetical protein
MQVSFDPWSRAGPWRTLAATGGNSAARLTEKTMKNSLKILACAIGLTAIGATAQANPPVAPILGLTGTWRVTVTTYNCSTLVQNPSFQSFLTFSLDGTLVETTSAPMFQPGQRSSGHGFWERTGRNFYHAVSEAFIQFGSTPPMGPPLKRGYQRIEQGISFTDRNHFSSDATATFFDETGAVVVSLCASAAAERMD